MRIHDNELLVDKFKETTEEKNNTGKSSVLFSEMLEYLRYMKA